MATKKKAPAMLNAGSVPLSWKRFAIAASVVGNIGFIVVVITMSTTNALDSMFVKEGLERYCAMYNDDKFLESTEEVKALRDYTCARGDAKTYFESGFNNYLKEEGL